MNEINFNMPALGQALQQQSSTQLDALPFGVIGFDNEGLVKVYNTYESQVAGLSFDSVIDADLFNTVAPCMNNFLVAQKFEDAVDEAAELDVIMDYVLTLKMKPTPVKLRLISSPQLTYHYVVILR